MTFQGYIDTDYYEMRARMADACASALDEIDDKLRVYERKGILKLWQMQDKTRLLQLRKDINKTLNELQYIIEPEVVGLVSDSYEIGYIINACTIEGTVANLGVSFAGVDQKLLEASVNQKIAGLTISDRLSKQRLDLLWHERDAIAKSKLLGYGQAKTAREIILADVQQGVQSSFSRACMIARTESTRNATAATLDADREANTYGIDTRSKWISGPSTKHPHDPPHSLYNGLVADHWSNTYNQYVFIIGGQESPGPGHCQNTKHNFGCRCAMGTVCMGYAEFYPSKADIEEYRSRYAA